MLWDQSDCRDRNCCLNPSTLQVAVLYSPRAPEVGGRTHLAPPPSRANGQTRLMNSEHRSAPPSATPPARRPRARPAKMATAMYLEHYLDSKRRTVPLPAPARAASAVPRTPQPACGPRGPATGRRGRQGAGPGGRSATGRGGRGGRGAGSRRLGRANSRCVTEGRGLRSLRPHLVPPLRRRLGVPLCLGLLTACCFGPGVFPLPGCCCCVFV